MSVGCTGGDITYNLKVDNSQVATSISELNRLLTTYVALARRLGIEGNLMDAIARFQQLRIAAETAYRSVMLLYTATGPIGWLIGIGGLGLSALMAADQMQARRTRY